MVSPRRTPSRRRAPLAPTNVFLNFVELDSARDFGLESSDSVDDTVYAHDEQYAVTYVPTVAINAKLSYCSSQRMVPFRSSVGFCT